MGRRASSANKWNQMNEWLWDELDSSGHCWTDGRNWCLWFFLDGPKQNQRDAGLSCLVSCYCAGDWLYWGKKNITPINGSTNQSQWFNRQIMIIMGQKYNRIKAANIIHVPIIGLTNYWLGQILVFPRGDRTWCKMEAARCNTVPTHFQRRMDTSHWANLVNTSIHYGSARSMNRKSLNGSAISLTLVD